MPVASTKSLQSESPKLLIKKERESCPNASARALTSESPEESTGGREKLAVRAGADQAAAREYSERFG